MTDHRKSDKTFKLYINSGNKRFWDVVKFAEQKGINVSSYLIEKILKNFDEDVSNPGMPLLSKPSFIPALIDLAKDYEKNGIEGSRMSYKIPAAFDNMEISNQDMVTLTLFALQLYITILKNDGVQKSIRIDPDSILRTRKDIDSLKNVSEFKRVLESHMVLDMDRIRRDEELREREEKDKRNREAVELYRQKTDLDRRVWDLMHPGVPYWQKGKTAEQIETSNKLFSGEWTIYEGEEEEEEVKY
jgi:hypothetical protein